jgi:hypothetical protein
MLKKQQAVLGKKYNSIVCFKDFFKCSENYFGSDDIGFVLNIKNKWVKEYIFLGFIFY